MTNNFLKDITKLNEYASVVADGTDFDTDVFIDTGSYILNALMSGSIHGGLPSNKITALAGESATGKTFFLMGTSRVFLIRIRMLVLSILNQKVQSQNRW